jgi:hypothetical protein
MAAIGEPFNKTNRGPLPMTPAHRIPDILRSPWLWISLGLVFLLATTALSDAPRSPFAPAEYLLCALLLGLFGWRGAGGLGLTLPRQMAPIAFIGLSWTFGMVYEATLTVDGTGVGGVHPDTRSSFILAQGDYLMIVLASWLLVRRWHLTFSDMVMVAGGKSLTEGLVFTGVLTAVLMSPMAPAAPFVIGYYTLAYAYFVALPLLIIAPASLWSDHPRPTRPGAARLWIIGFVLAFVIRVIWGLGWAPLATMVFDLPPNLPTL